MKIGQKITLILTLTCGALWGGGFALPENEFIFGMYSAEGPGGIVKSFPQLKAIGINYVHTYRRPKTVADQRYCREFLDLAKQYQLKVLFTLGGNQVLKKADGIEQLKQRVNMFKAHPAVGMWYIYDEPKADLAPKLKEVTAALHQISPLPTNIVVCWVTNWWYIAKSSDVMMADIYPIRGEKFPQAPLQQYTKFITDAARNKKGNMIAVMQAWDWRGFNHFVKESPQLRFPNAEELRYMGYASFAAGVRGMFFFSMARMRLHEPANMTWFQKSFTPFMAEMKGFTEKVSKPWEVTTLPYNFNKAQKISLAHWSRPNGEYIVLTNNTKEQRNLDLDLTAFEKIPRQGKLIPLGKTRENGGTLQNGHLKIADCQPWEAWAWKIKK